MNCGYKEKRNDRDLTSPNLITKKKQQKKILWLFFCSYSKSIFQKNINSTKSLTETL